MVEANIIDVFLFFLSMDSLRFSLRVLSSEKLEHKLLKLN
jgi:hypothetical protein